MKIGVRSISVTRLWWLGMIAVSLASRGTAAEVHIVQFGGTLGEAYSPSSFAAVVGDTVRWVGSFGSHPLSSTSIPVGASAWHNSSGSTFDYVIAVAGTYNYQCDFHQPIMVGSFTAVVTGVEGNGGGEAPMGFRLEQNYPNPFNPSTVMSYQLAVPSTVRLAVFDILGREVALLVNGQEAGGNYQVRFDARGLASGMYEYRLTARPTDGGQSASFVQSKRMLLAR